MEILIHTLEKVGVLVTLMFVLGRTGFVARLAVRPARPPASLRSCSPLPALAFFTLMALTEFGIAAHQRSLLNARIVATCTAGLLAGPWIGTAIGAIAGLLALVLVNASPVGYILP